MHYLCNEKVVIISNWNPHTVRVEIKTSTIFFWKTIGNFSQKLNMCSGSPTSGAVQYPSCLCTLMPVYSRAFNRALAEAKSPAPSGLPAHLKDGGDPLLPNPAWPFVHLTGPLPFRTTPKAETAERAQGGYNCLQPWSCPAPSTPPPGSKDKKPPKSWGLAALLSESTL